MGMTDNQDINTLMEFRGQHWEQWVEFVKGNKDYCNKCSNHKEYCICEEVQE